MSVTRIASRYAKSLLDLAIERSELDVVLSDIKSFDSYTENRDFYLLLKSPIVPKGKKAEVFRALFDEKLNKTTRSFLDIILRKGREQYLPEIADEFILQHKKMNEVSSVTLKTATELSDQQLNDIKSKLLASSVTEKTVEIIHEVDPSIIGGFIVQIGDRLYDASVLHQLDKLKKEFTGNDYVKAY